MKTLKTRSKIGYSLFAVLSLSTAAFVHGTQSPVISEMMFSGSLGSNSKSAAMSSPDPDEPTGIDPVVETCEKESPELLTSISDEWALIEEERAKLEADKRENDLVSEKVRFEVSQLTELKTDVSAILDQMDKAHTDDLKRLVTIYQGMKATEAARLLNDLGVEVTVMILGDMPERSVSPILANMNSVKAQAISKIIYERAKLPADQDLNGIKLE
jgi:flagellar motility protein MotE (MotC chaperone)